MAIKGSHPVLIFWIQSSGLTSEEAEELQALKSGVQSPEFDNTQNRARLDALNTKAKAGYAASRTPIPIILDSKITQAYVSNQGFSINKSISYIDSNDDENSNVVSKNSNHLSLSITVAKNERIYSLIVNACIAVSQYYFNKSDAIANVSYFSEEAIIMNGYLNSFSRQNTAGATKDQITLQISNIEKEKEPEIKKTEQKSNVIKDLT